VWGSKKVRVIIKKETDRKRERERRRVIFKRMRGRERETDRQRQLSENSLNCTFK